MAALDLSICNDINDILQSNGIDDKWFCLKNNNLDKELFKRLINNLEKTFNETFGIEGAKTYIKRIKEINDTHLFINQVKVPNIVKHILYDNRLNTSINLTGKKPNGEIETKQFETWDRNDCLKLIPFYHAIEKSNSIESATQKINPRKA